MGKVRNILQSKKEKFCTVGPQITVFEAIEIMSEKNIAAVLVVEQDQLAGIFTEHDYTRKVILKGKSSRLTLVGELMSRNPHRVTSDDTVEECMNIMNLNKIRHLPVVDEGRLVGVVSVGDLIRFMIEEQRGIIEHLENYITH